MLVSADAANRVIKAGERQPISLSISHYGDKPIRNGRLVWTVLENSRIVNTGSFEEVEVAVGQVKEIGKLALGSRNLKRAVKLTLEVRLDSSSCNQENSWDFWAFPARKRDFTGAGVTNLTGLKALSDRYGAQTTLEPDSTCVVVTDQMNPEVLEYVTAGGVAVLLTESGALRNPLPLQYWPQGLRSVGYLVEDDPSSTIILMRVFVIISSTDCLALA